MFENKNLFGSIIPCDIKTPYAYVHKIDGEYYDNAMHQIEENDAIDCLKIQSVCILKDAIDSSGGYGVQKLVRKIEDDDTKWENRLKQAFYLHKEDFVVQECIEQHQSMAQFNSSSVNTFRITTLYLNGQFSVLNIALRFGKKNMKVDNWGSGGIMIGVDVTGKLRSTGYDIQLNEFKEYNGIVFGQNCIAQVPQIIAQIKKTHETVFSLCKLIGWDVCIDCKGNPVVIEINSSQPGIIGEQLCCGPIFGNRTKEVIDYCRAREFRYHKVIVSI